MIRTYNAHTGRYELDQPKRTTKAINPLEERIKKLEEVVGRLTEAKTFKAFKNKST
jgi:hypothetical protein